MQRRQRERCRSATASASDSPSLWPNGPERLKKMPDQDFSSLFFQYKLFEICEN
jgi:hypothetical protein